MKRVIWLWLIGAFPAGVWGLSGGGVEMFENVPAEVRREPAKWGKTAVYFDCGKKFLTIQPGGTVVSNLSALALSETNSVVRQTLEYVQANREKFFLMVIQRPDSAATFAAVHRMFYLRRIEVAQEIVDDGVEVLEATKRPDFVLGPLARPVDMRPVMFECRSNQLFYVSNNELAWEAGRFLQRYRPLSRREDIELAQRAMTQRAIQDENYLLDGPAFITGMVRLRPKPGATGEAVGDVADKQGLFLKRLRTLDFKRLYLQFLVRDDSFEIVRQGREVAEKEGFEWRIRLLRPDETLDFQVR